ERALAEQPSLGAIVERVGRRELDPVSAAEEIVTAVLGGEPGGHCRAVFMKKKPSRKEDGRWWPFFSPGWSFYFTLCKLLLL
ncbi:MAG: hypothetical protein ACM3ZR_07205, partial [Pseudomonadota bacterium]